MNIVGSIVEDLYERDLNLADVNGRMFSTPDKDHDNSTEHCAKKYGAGWWFGNCDYAYLNGQFDDMTMPHWNGRQRIKASMMMVWRRRW
jgi:hypothetical protein